MYIGSLAIITESAKRKKSKLSAEDKMIKKDYDTFKAHNSTFAKKWGLDKHDLADNKGLTGKGSALLGGAVGAIQGIPFGPAGMAAGGVAGALAGAGAGKLNRYMVHRTYGHLDKKGDPDW